MAPFPFTVFAHVFGQTYTLPVPLWLFLFGAGAAVAVSFAVVALITGERPSESKRPIVTKELGGVVETGRFLGVLLLALTVIAGLTGTQDSQSSFSVTFFWVIFLLGFTYTVMIFGNLWEFVNPFKTLMQGIEGLIGRKVRPRAEYPKWLGYWPALLSYYALIWVEIIGGGIGAVPRDLSILIIGYTILTLAGAFLFGRESWFQYGELFSVFFRLVSKVSLVKISSGTFSWRRPLDGLVGVRGATFSLLLFILFMLASTGFDGLKETVVFGRLVELLPSYLSSNFYIAGGLGLALMPFVLLAVYLSFVVLMKWLVSADLSVRELAYRFSFSLIPIAVAYYVAHYFTMLLITGQGVIPALSDPLGSGLNLFGTADYKPNIVFLGASAVWYIQVFLIIAGHVGAIYVAHREALEIFGNRHKALLSQIPMAVLMVLYTIASLWIIAQPIAV